MGLPDWLEPLPDAELMRATDRWAIEERGVPSLKLMERAGEGLADLTDHVGPTGLVVVVCGPGNNGGDGFVAARLLRDAGRDVKVVVTAALDAYEGDAKANLDVLREQPAPFEPGSLDGAAVVVDCLLGTGFSGDVREPVRSAILALNDCGAPVVACDVPSGVDASTGAVEDVAVEALATATFHHFKPGLWIAPGKQRAGDVHVIAIGIPPGAPGEPRAGLIGEGVFDAIPRRGAESTKFSSGHVLVVGGSTGLTGAPCLAAEAAMRAGAGYVTCCVPASLNLVFETRLLEVMTIPLPDDDDGALTIDGLDRVVAEASRRGGALVAGPGLSKAPVAAELARALVARAEVPVVLDADGLDAHAGRLEDLRARSAPTILTPHGGELARLMGVESDAVNARRLWHAREAAGAAGAIVVLKGDDTIVAAPDGLAAISPGGVPALATAGTGDVLAGVVAALLAKGLEPFAAAAAGVLSHLHAGASAAQRRSPDAVIASDVVEALGRPR